MSKITGLITVLGLLLPLGLWAAPQAAADKQLQDVGRVTQGAPASAAYLIFNRGDSVLVLKPQACCGLTLKAPQGLEIRPGQRSRLLLSYETAYQTGDFYKTLAIETNDPRLPELRLALKGQILAELSIRPELIDFGQIKAGTTARRSLTLTNHSRHSLRLSPIELRPGFRLTGQAPTRLAPGQSVQLEIVFTAPRWPGNFWSALKFTTDLNYQPARTVPIRAVVR